MNRIVQKLTIDSSNNWHVTHAEVSSSQKCAQIPNEDNESILLKNSTILEVYIMLQEKNKLWHQFFSVPIVGKFDLGQ